FLLLLFALPTAGALSLRDATADPRAGWVLRLAQIGAVATYFLSAWAKLRFGGIDWVNSATIQRAIVRRGTFIGDFFANIPQFIHIFQWVMVTGELLSPILFIRRWTTKLVVVAFLFHAMTYACLTIGFWPHQVSLLAFLPLEAVLAWRLLPTGAGRARREASRSRLRRATMRGETAAHDA
ncbi:MAG: transporter permease, partial [Acidimicrobiales bacterium]|nr:transporter permease [Acidimicrobiales bacterium]